MFIIIGIVVVMGSMLGGYVLHHGNVMVLLQWTEFLIIGGVAIGSMILAHPIYIIKAIISGALHALKGNHITKESYLEVLKLQYELFQFAKREGLIALEPHVENPTSSSIISKYNTFVHNHHALLLLCDTLKVVLSGGVPAHDLEELMDLDLNALHEEEHLVTSALTMVSDAFPGIGIVAAVLGVIITMGSISAGADAVGANVAAALVGTFLGILLSYGIVGPLAKSIEYVHYHESKYLGCIKASVISFAKGAPAAVAVEFGRRAIPPEFRPTFAETEQAVKG